ncbi:cupin domain-containing protein [Kitasatospora sp. NPDC056181]|uniref:cupin domain-containing protein n=1 Tax=Kitasatospora sp. NPDC056181 TaxID=3345737 RepID=UPI0035D864CF
MILVPAAVPRTAPAFRRLIDPRRLPSALGGLTVETLPPGVRVGQPPSPAGESVTVVLSGRVRSAGRVLGPGEGLYHPPGSDCGLVVLPGAPAVVLTVRAGTSAGPPPAPAPSAVPLAAPPRRTGPLEGEDGPAAGGPAGTAVHWLATAETVGARQVAVAASGFAPGGSHELHRHPHADQFFLVLAGGGRHLAATREVAVRPGDLVYVPAGEWHGFRAGPGHPTTAVFGHLGAASPARAGYQVRSAAEEALR